MGVFDTGERMRFFFLVFLALFLLGCPTQESSKNVEEVSRPHRFECEKDFRIGYYLLQVCEDKKLGFVCYVVNEGVECFDLTKR